MQPPPNFNLLKCSTNSKQASVGFQFRQAATISTLFPSRNAITFSAPPAAKSQNATCSPGTCSIVLAKFFSNIPRLSALFELSWSNSLMCLAAKSDGYINWRSRSRCCSVICGQSYELTRRVQNSFLCVENEL